MDPHRRDALNSKLSTWTLLLSAAVAVVAAIAGFLRSGG